MGSFYVETACGKYATLPVSTEPSLRFIEFLKNTPFFLMFFGWYSNILGSRLARSFYVETARGRAPSA